MLKTLSPVEDGESPLAKIDSFVQLQVPEVRQATQSAKQIQCLSGQAHRWYFLRYCDPHNDKDFASQEALKYWLPVDWYNGGMEHVTRHLIYSRFWHKFPLRHRRSSHARALRKAYRTGSYLRSGRREDEQSQEAT